MGSNFAAARTIQLVNAAGFEHLPTVAALQFNPKIGVSFGIEFDVFRRDFEILDFFVVCHGVQSLNGYMSIATL